MQGENMQFSETKELCTYIRKNKQFNSYPANVENMVSY